MWGMGGYQAWEYDGMVGMPPIVTMRKQRPQRGGNIAKKVTWGVIIYIKNAKRAGCPPPPLCLLYTCNAVANRMHRHY